MDVHRTLLTVAVIATLATPVLADPTDDVPPEFGTRGRASIIALQAIGAQIYQCTQMGDGTRSWRFREPIAALIQDGKTVGRHYAGPNWDMGDGGVTGKVMTSAPGATSDDIPSLALQVVAHRGGGLLQEAQMVLRLHAVGGMLAGTCSREGELKAVPYRADYVFLK